MFVRFPGRDSWDVFKEIMEKVQVGHRSFFRKTLVVALPVVAVALHSSELAIVTSAAQVVTTPGSGFGPSGQGFVRISAFGHREDVEEALGRFKANWS